MQDVVCILGTTGVGKSRLAVTLAQAAARFHNASPTSVPSAGPSNGQPVSAEIINSDAMQVYKALPLLTAKVSEAEKQGVPHRLMSFLDPLKDEYVVLDFVKDARENISDLHEQHKLPIVVGGTAYYVQHLIAPPVPASKAPARDFHQRAALLPPDQRHLLHLLPQLPNSSATSTYPPGFPVHLLPERLQGDSEAFAWDCWNLLNALDAETASRWHWRDIRKVRRQIELSLPEMYAHKTAPAGGHQDGSGEPANVPRYRVLLFWLHCQRDVLQVRLDKRVDGMIQDGLLDEVRDLYTAQQASNVDVDYSRGVCQAIGYKPFSQYLQQPSSDQSAQRQRRAWADAVEQTKIQTRQYAKRQINWLKSKLWPTIQQQHQQGDRSIEFFVLDTTDPDKFEHDVEGQASDLLCRFLSREPLPERLEVCPLASELLHTTERDPASLAKYTCEACTVDAARPVIIEERQREVHERTKMHQKRSIGRHSR